MNTLLILLYSITTHQIRETMKITRTSPFSGKEHTLEIPVTEEQLKAWHSGTLIQDAMPNISADHREFPAAA